MDNEVSECSSVDEIVQQLYTMDYILDELKATIQENDENVYFLLNEYDDNVESGSVSDDYKEELTRLDEQWQETLSRLNEEYKKLRLMMLEQLL